MAAKRKRAMKMDAEDRADMKRGKKPTAAEEAREAKGAKKKAPAKRAKKKAPAKGRTRGAGY